MMEEGSVLYVPVIKDERSKAVLPVFDFCTRLTAADYIRAQVSGVRGQGRCPPKADGFYQPTITRLVLQSVAVGNTFIRR